MKYFRKRKLLRELNRLLDRANAMEFQHFIDSTSVRHSDDFCSWLEETSHTLGQVFGETSEQKRRFQELDFGFGGEPHRDLFLEHTAEANAILKGCIYRISTYGLPVQSSTAQSLQDDISRAARKSVSAKSKFRWVLERVILPLFLMIASFVLGSYWNDYREARKALESPNEMYKQVGVNFYNWLEDYDRTLMSDFEKLLADAARRGMLESGPTVKQTIEYFREFRRKRDNKIDSFLVAYSLAGGETEIQTKASGQCAQDCRITVG